jgi:hypothetical protein
MDYKNNDLEMDFDNLIFKTSQFQLKKEAI